MFLDELPIGQPAQVFAIHAEQALVQRLQAMGFRSGKSIQIIRQAAFGGPLQVRLGSTDVMIRVTDARCIQLSSSPQST